MSGTTADVMVQDAVDPYELFTAAREIVGLPPDARWSLHTDVGEVHLLRTAKNQGASALVHAHFVPGGAPYPHDEDEEEQPLHPPGYVLLSFHDGRDDTESVRHNLRQLVAELGQWLNARDLRWVWRHEHYAPMWLVGHTKAAVEHGEQTNT